MDVRTIKERGNSPHNRHIIIIIVSHCIAQQVCKCVVFIVIIAVMHTTWHDKDIKKTRRQKSKHDQEDSNIVDCKICAKKRKKEKNSMKSANVYRMNQISYTHWGMFAATTMAHERRRFRSTQVLSKQMYNVHTSSTDNMHT